MMDYLIECHRSTREEILFRVKNRDGWLKLQLLSQAVLLALSGGVKLGGVEAQAAIPNVLSLAVPLSLVFLCLYYRENKLVAHLSTYLSQFPAMTIAESAEQGNLANWDSSEDLAQYSQETTFFRLVAEAISFGLIPAGLLMVWFLPATRPTWFGYAIIGVEFCLLGALVITIRRSFNYLRQSVRSFGEDRPTKP